MQAHTQKFWFAENLGNIPDNPCENGAQRCLTSKNGAQGLQKNTWRPVLEAAPEKVVMIFVEKVCRKKVAQNTFRGSLEKFGQKSFTTPKMFLLLNLW